MASRLDTYRRKRNFSRTAEPPGKAKVAAADHPRFVIQKHDATRLHYDLRLEVQGTFKSWAVTKGPSLDPKQKRLAVEVEDHPLDYGDFEGIIPQSEYGGGTVMIWDRGFWSPDNGDPEKALRKGELKFTLGGEKLKGSFVLVRMAHDKTGSGRSNWLLIKHKDEWASTRAKVEQDDRSVASGRTMDEIGKSTGTSPKPFVAITGGSGGGAKIKPTKPAPPETFDFAAVKAEAERVEGIKITHPDRLVWPDEGITKLELAEYLATVGPWMIAHIANRPCSALRAPDGIGGQTFFQRHLMAGMPEDIAPYPVKGEREPYIRADSVAALVGLAQFGTIEFHPWNSAEGEAEVPGRLVFDLDPSPEVPFDRVIGAAKDLRRRLEKLGLVPFCKTTGGKGLHVVTPLGGGKPLTFAEAKTFSQAVCKQMADDQPDLYLTNMSKSRRKGRIFLDYLRNDRTATAVAPLSPRARPGAAVSMPLTWAQARSGLDPSRFTVRTAPALMRKSRPWANYLQSARPLEGAIRALIGGNA